MKQCPQCEGYVPDENYCASCGYAMKDSYGYWRKNYSTMIELNKNFIRVFPLTYIQNVGNVRGYGDKYLLEKIENPEITWCGKLIFTSPCLQFNYKNSPVKIFINKEMVGFLKTMLPTLNQSEELTGWGQWFTHQKKTRLGIAVLVVVILLYAGSSLILPYFSPSYEYLNLTSASSDIPGLQFSNVTGFYPIEVKGDPEVEGYIENTGNQAQSSIEINITGYDSAGNIVDTDEVPLVVSNDPNSKLIDTLEPGSKGYFSMLFDDPNRKIVRYTVSAVKDTY